MIDPSVSNFYTKNADREDYAANYVSSHRARCKWVMERFGLDKLSNQRIVGIGEGMGNNFEHLHPSNYMVSLDGAAIKPEQKLTDFLSLRVDLNEKGWGNLFDNEGKFDSLIACELIEHVANINNLMLEMKKMVKENGVAVFTIPDFEMTHPVAFPGLFFPWQSFVTFIEQYAWLVEEHAVFESGWKTQCFKVRNAPMKEQRPLFHKHEEKFWGQDPITWSNL